MDHPWFDRVVRAWAERRVGRRALLASVVAASAARSGSRRGTAAQAIEGAAGMPCRSNEMCAAFSPALQCADNGSADDGPLNCCYDAGFACAVDTECCGSLSCDDGACSGQRLGTLFPGSPCTATFQCAIGQGGYYYCADNGLAEDGPLNCCGYEGTGCRSDNHCCAGLVCLGGICAD